MLQGSPFGPVRQIFELGQGSDKKNAGYKREQKSFHEANLKSQGTQIDNRGGIKSPIFGAGEMNCAR
jgi:hypothetical protein